METLSSIILRECEFYCRCRRVDTSRCAEVMPPSEAKPGIADDPVIIWLDGTSHAQACSEASCGRHRSITTLATIAEHPSRQTCAPPPDPLKTGHLLLPMQVSATAWCATHGDTLALGHTARDDGNSSMNISDQSSCISSASCSTATSNSSTTTSNSSTTTSRSHSWSADQPKLATNVSRLPNLIVHVFRQPLTPPRSSGPLRRPSEQNAASPKVLYHPQSKALRRSRASSADQVQLVLARLRFGLNESDSALAADDLFDSFGPGKSGEGSPSCKSVQIGGYTNTCLSCQPFVHVCAVVVNLSMEAWTMATDHCCGHCCCTHEHVGEGVHSYHTRTRCGLAPPHAYPCHSLLNHSPSHVCGAESQPGPSVTVTHAAAPAAAALPQQAMAHGQPLMQPKLRRLTRVNSRSRLCRSSSAVEHSLRVRLPNTSNGSTAHSADTPSCTMHLQGPPPEWHGTMTAKAWRPCSAPSQPLAPNSGLPCEEQPADAAISHKQFYSTSQLAHQARLQFGLNVAHSLQLSSSLPAC